MIITKKHILYGALIILGTLLIAFIGALALRNFVKQPTGDTSSPSTSNTSEQKSISSEQGAQDSIAAAKKARESQDFTTAISAYQKARTYYTAKNDIAQLANIDAALSLLEVERKNVPTAPKPALAGEE